MIQATFAATLTAAAGDEQADDGATPASSRTINGVAVPWNEIGVISDGRRVRFLPGSLDAAARPIVVLGHDGPAIGRVSENTATDTGMISAVRVSRVPDGDTALILAADGVLGMFSVGADPTDSDYDDAGVLNVRAASWQHLALLPFGAFAGAVVTDVAASQPSPSTTTGVPAVTDLLTTNPPAVELAAGLSDALVPAVIPLHTGQRPTHEPMTLARLAALVAGANRGEINGAAARAQIQAALANVVSTDVGAIVPPAYRAELTGIIDHGTPLLTVLGGSPLPGNGMSIEYPQWLVTPTTGIQATEKTQITSTPATMTLRTAPVITIAGGNDLSLQSVERSSPSFLDAYLRAMAVDWGRKAEAYVLSVITPLAAVVPSVPGATFLENVQALIGALDPALTPAGQLFVAMSSDVALPLISVKQADGPAFWSGSINFGNMTSTVTNDAGLTIFVDWNLPANTMLGGSTQAAPVHVSPGAPADIRVVDVSLLGLDVGVYGYIAVTPEYPDALAILTVS